MNIVEPIIASARAERKRQGEYLLRARSDALAPSKLAEELRSRLEANLERRAKTEDVAKVWGLFPSVIKEKLPNAVERRILDRFESFISEERLEVSAEEVEKVILSDPKSHVKASESEKVFASVYGANVLSEAKLILALLMQLANRTQ